MAGPRRRRRRWWWRWRRRPPKSEWRSRFGEPVPAFVTWLSVAFVISACVTVDGRGARVRLQVERDRPGHVRRRHRRAADRVRRGVARVPGRRDAVPGAKMSRHVPKLENDARASVFVVAPTVIAAATRAGESCTRSRSSCRPRSRTRRRR